MLAKTTEFQNACKKMPKALREYEAFVELKRTIDDFLETLPLVQQLAHPSMRSRHWTGLMSVTGRQLAVHSDSFKLSTLLEADLLEFIEDVEDITNSAMKELQIEEKLGVIAEEWADCQLSFATFKNRGPIQLQGGPTAELLEKLEEAQMNLGSMLASRYIGPFRDEVASWVAKLFFVSEILEQWVQVQAMWMYLEAVFTSGDIAKQMPTEAKRFQSIDKNWEKVMAKAYETRNVVQYCFGNDVLKNLLPHLLEQLEVCQKALSGYLDQKRAAFPRFYFVSDAVLLEVLSQGSNPEAIQPHLPSVFDSVDSITFDKADKTKVIAFKSEIGEGLDLCQTVTAVGNIEDWLDLLMKAIQKTINQTVQAAALDCESMGIADFTHKYPAQVSLIGIQFIWTLDAEDALYRSKTEKGVMNLANKKNQQRLNDLIAINLKTDQELAAFGKWTRRKVETMILVDVHQRDVFDEMVKRKVKDVEDFDWAKQARFYWRDDLHVAKVHVADVDFDYCNEYLGVKERLVITPLTDRCYITLSQALGMCLGGAPAGPAGTGKTETTKDMGCTLGKLVLVTNCGDQMDYRSTGRIIKGLAQAGCWGCFDEFNRIDLEVLSVVAQQVGSVLATIKADLKQFLFTDGQLINLDKEVGYFITMNPGYAGRQELPENLKSLFRGVTMMVPDRQIIMKVKLTGAGYKENALLGKKFNVLYKLCEEQLSKQAHYDFGLRNILAVLRTAGQSKRDDLNASESMLLMRTLRDMNLSKFVAEDVPLFLSLIEDLFPGLKAAKMQHKAVEASLAKRLPELNLQALPSWVNKVVQVYEMSLVRHSLMLVGPSGTGKSRIVETLHRTLEGCTASDAEPPMVGQTHKEVRMNPKAITAPQMFGCMDVVANEWTEGIFASLWRKANKDRKHFTWIVLDGPVDAIWIENMNTVMDDNRILTLANNDRIPMLRPNCTLHFEVEDLRNASPATVSRAGIIYVSLADLGWQPMVQSWVHGSKRPAGEAEVLEKLFDDVVPGVLEYITLECSPCMTATPVSLLTSTVVLLSALLGPEEAKEAKDPQVVERLFLYALIWSVAGVLEAKDRTKMDKYLRGLTKNLPAPAEATDSVYEFKVSDETGEWVHWQTLIPKWTLPAGGGVGEQFASLLVPTIDSVRNEYTLGLTAGMGRSVLFIGGPGTAKTSTVLQYLAKQDKSTTIFKKLSFSSATTPVIFQRQIESSVEKRQGRTFGPPGGKKMLVFIDDLSMPEYNAWGDQITLEIVRQLMEYTGMYNLDKPGEWKTIKDLLFLGAMLHPGGGKNDIPNRAKRHFHVMNVTLPSAASIHQIFGSMLKAHFPPESDAKVHRDHGFYLVSRRLLLRTAGTLVS
jgi:dynein heavy chain